MRTARTRTTANRATGLSDHSSLAAEASVHEEPVQENCTPGSVRGLSGNWQSYRDQLGVGVNDRSAWFLERLRASDPVLDEWHSKI